MILRKLTYTEADGGYFHSGVWLCWSESTEEGFENGSPSSPFSISYEAMPLQNGSEIGDSIQNVFLRCCR